MMLICYETPVACALTAVWYRSPSVLGLAGNAQQWPERCEASSQLLKSRCTVSAEDTPLALLELASLLYK